jgi:hypothetical protein
MWRDGEDESWEDCDGCGGTGEISDVQHVVNSIAEVFKHGYDPKAIIMHPPDNKKTVFQRAIELWGEEAQIKMAIEECAELIVKLAKLGRFKNGSQIHEVAEEIADVEIMMSQLRLIFGNGCVDGAKSDKLLILLSRVIEGEEAGKKNG